MQFDRKEAVLVIVDWEIGLRWMEKKGAMISTTEIIAFRLLKEAGTEEFRRLSKLLKESS